MGDIGTSSYNIPRIAIAGLSCETSTFSPARTHAAAFKPRCGDEVIDEYQFLHASTPLGDAAEWHGALIGYALPGGIVTKHAFEELSAEILSRLQSIVDKASLDGIWFDIHGAMCVEGIDDSEAELLRRIRKVIGPSTIVSASMDLHGNVSQDLIHQTDIITCYRTAPHEDVTETKERACRNLIRLLNQREEASTQSLPIKAWIPVPVLLPGEQTSTRLEPAKHIYAAVPEVEGESGVVDAAIWVGYAWADEPRSHAVVAVTGWDPSAVTKGAERLARLFWNAHTDFEFAAPTAPFEKCLDTALASSSRPYFISDSGDNPTAGGCGDVTWTLTHLLSRAELQSLLSPKVIYASIPGRKATELAVETGIGARITVTAGAEVDSTHAGPVTMTGRVHAIKHGDRHAEIEVVLQVGSVFVILTKFRKPYHYEHDFTDLDLSLRKGFDIVIVKIGYLEPELYNCAADWMLALTPGGVDQDLERLGHKRILRPMWPFDKRFETEPDLTARIIPPSNEPLTGVGE